MQRRGNNSYFLSFLRRQICCCHDHVPNRLRWLTHLKKDPSHDKSIIWRCDFWIHDSILKSCEICLHCQTFNRLFLPNLE